MNGVLKTLIVDDHLISQKVLAGQLRAIGLQEIDTVSSGEEALALLVQGHYDIVLFDYMMPEMDGLAFLIECRKLGYLERIAFMLVTADVDESHIMSILREGALCYINKPIFQEELNDKIQDIIKWLDEK